MTNFKLIANKVEIELAKNSNFSFSKENQIWQFDRILLERSQSIKIPKTKKNTEIFGFSDRVDFSGIEMKQTYEASLWYSGGKIDGELFVVDFSNGFFNCVFVFGKNRIFKELKEAGKLKDVLTIIEDTRSWDENSEIQDSDVEPSYLDFYRYVIDGLENEAGRGAEWNFMPSTSLSKLLYVAAIDLNITINTSLIDDYLKKIGIKLNGLNSERAKLAVHTDNITFIANGTPQGINADYFDYKGSLTISNGVYGGEKGFAFAADFYAPKFIEAKNDFILGVRFKQNYNFDNETIDKGIYIFRDGEFIGRLSDRYPFGTNLSMKVLKGDWIAFGERYKDFIGGGGYFTVRAKSYENPDFDLLTFDYLAEDGKITYPAIYQLRPNLPDITVLDLLKIAANLTNTSFYIVKGQNTISFFDYNFENDNIIDLSEKVISVNLIKRSILDYAQNNYIDFASSDKVLDSSKLRNNVQIANKNLENEKTIYTIPFSEGNIGSYDNTTGNYRLKLSDIQVQTDENGNKTYSFGKDKDTLFMVSDVAGGSTQQVKFRSGSKLPEIFQNSTSVELTIEQRLFEFMQMDEFSIFLYKNKRWSWSDAKWEDNKTKLSLIKIPDTFKLFGYLAQISKQQIIISNNDYSSAVADLRLSYNDKEIFPVYDDALDNVLVPKNLLLKSGEEVTNNLYRLHSYTPSEFLVQDEVYTALYDIKLKDNATSIALHLSNGSTGQLFGIRSPIVGVRSVQIATGEARYIEGKTPEDKPSNGILRLYIAPNEVGGADNTIYKIKVEKGSNPNPVWTPAPEDSVYISNYSSNVTATISDGQLKVTNMSGSEGWVEVTFEYYKFSETKRILITKN